MKTIYIARHAKSSWIDPKIADIDRPLKTSGILAVQKVAERLRDCENSIDALFTSPALRAEQTALILAENLGFLKENIDIRESIYFQGKKGIYDLIKSLDNHLESIMICGHNPTLTDFTNDFLQIPLEKMQTSSVMKIQFITDIWSQIPFADVKQLNYFNRQETKELKYATKSS